MPTKPYYGMNAPFPTLASDDPNQNAIGKGAGLRAMYREAPIETCLLIALLLGLSWVPFWAGSTWPISQGINALWFPGLTVFYEISLLVRARKHPFGLKRVALSAGLFMVVVAWITVQLSNSVPLSVQHPIWGMATEVLGQPAPGAISVNPSATALALMRLVTDASVAWLSCQLCRNSTRANQLLRWVAATVAVYSLYGILLTAFYGGGILFYDTPSVPGVVRSTFVNRNNFATYAGLGLVVSVALLLRMYRREVPNAEGLSTYRLTKLIEATGRRGWAFLGSTFVTLVALLGSVSRGGILASAVGVFAILVFSFTRSRRRRSEQIEALVFVSVGAAAVLVLFGDAIVGRIATGGLADVNRAAVYQVTWRAILDSPVLGFGYATFADVFPMYRDNSTSTYGVWEMAHNSYLEAWLGLGLVFGSMLIVSIGALAVQCALGAIKRQRDATPAMVGAAASILVGVHSLVDFSVQIDAISLTFMALLGAGVAESISSRTIVSD